MSKTKPMLPPLSSVSAYVVETSSWFTETPESAFLAYRDHAEDGRDRRQDRSRGSGNGSSTRIAVCVDSNSIGCLVPVRSANRAAREATGAFVSASPRVFGVLGGPVTFSTQCELDARPLLSEIGVCERPPSPRPSAIARSLGIRMRSRDFHCRRA